MNEEIARNENDTVPGPGRLLQNAREEKNLRPEDIAYEIRLTPSQVLALEENDYSKMPEETYVRGYLRNYARLVGVPENDILMAFARLTRAKDVSSDPINIATESEANKSSKTVRVIAVASIAAIVLLSAVWVFVPSAERPQADRGSGPAVIAERADIEEVPEGNSTLNLGKSDIEPGLNLSPISPDSGTASFSKKKTRREVYPPAISTNNTKTVDTSKLNNKKIISDGGTLLISYSKDSWTDVRDARGSKLLYRTVKAGEKVALAGELPISLFFGFAQGVKVKFNGKDIDISAHTRGVFARLTVGEAVNQ